MNKSDIEDTKDAKDAKPKKDADVTFTPDEVAGILEALWKANALLKIAGVTSDDLDMNEVETIVDDHDKTVQQLSIKLMRLVGRSGTR